MRLTLRRVRAGGRSPASSAAPTSPPCCRACRPTPQRSPAQRGACAGALWSLRLRRPRAHPRRPAAVRRARPAGRLPHRPVRARPRGSAARSRAARRHRQRRGRRGTTTSFLAALPSLRLAFTYFTPREKAYLARALFDAETSAEAAAVGAVRLAVSTAEAAEAMAFETRLFDAIAEQYGVRLAFGARPGRSAMSDHGRTRSAGGWSSATRPSRALRRPLRRGRRIATRRWSYLYDREATGRNRRAGGRGGRAAAAARLRSVAADGPGRGSTRSTRCSRSAPIERLEKDALERYQLEELVTNPDVLRGPSRT